MTHFQVACAFLLGLFGRRALDRLLQVLRGLQIGRRSPTCANTRLLEDIAQVNEEGELDVLPYSDFAACSLLGLRPSAQNVHRTWVYESLKCVSAAFLRANRGEVQTALKHPGLQALLNECELPAPPGHAARCFLTLRQRDAKAHPSATPAAKSLTDACSTPTDLLLQELERLLFMYLSRNWDQMAALVDVNQEDLEVTCHRCVCGGHESSALHSVASFDSLGSSPSSLHSVHSYPSIHSTPSVNGLVHWTGSNGHLKLSVSERAQHNWARARKVVQKYRATRRLGKPHRINGLMELLSHSHRQNTEGQPGHPPVLLLLGGGMAAGKTTVRELIGQSEFWSMVGNDAVVVEADAIKNQDKIYQDLKLNEFKHDLSIDEVVHEYFTKAAENMLVAAINMQRDVVFDGTHVWPPFIEQTISMARDHQHRYKLGPGYRQAEDGSGSEIYWLPEQQNDEQNVAPACHSRKPYRVELIGVTCDPGLAVARGIWRKLRTGRGVPVRAQLRSHRLFSKNFERFAKLVDSATLYHTGSALTMFNKWSMDVSPKIIAHCSSHTQREMLVNSAEYSRFVGLKHINDNATCMRELYGNHGGGSRCPLAHVSDEQAAALKGITKVLRNKHQRERERDLEKHQRQEGEELCDPC